MKTVIVNFGHIFILGFVMALLMTGIWFFLIPMIKRKIRRCNLKKLQKGDYVTFFVNHTPCLGKIKKTEGDNLELSHLGYLYNRKISEVTI
jgi:hypothetical protein